MSRISDAQARLAAAIVRLDTALQALEANARVAVESRDRQIATLAAEITALKHERDTLDQSAGLAASRIDAVIERLRLSQG